MNDDTKQFIKIEIHVPNGEYRALYVELEDVEDFRVEEIIVTNTRQLKALRAVTKSANNTIEHTPVNDEESMMHGVLSILRNANQSIIEWIDRAIEKRVML